MDPSSRLRRPIVLPLTSSNGRDYYLLSLDLSSSRRSAAVGYQTRCPRRVKSLDDVSGRVESRPAGTQERLAEATDFHWTHVGPVERGERNVRLRNILKLTHRLGIDDQESGLLAVLDPWMRPAEPTG